MEILCGQCGRTISVGGAGTVNADGCTIACPHCGHSILVPRVDGLDIAGAGSGPASPAAGEGQPPPDEEEGFAANARLAMKQKIRAVCGSCGKGLSINPKHAGRIGRCPSCGGKIQIPKREEEAPDFPISSQREGYVDDIELIEEPGADGGPDGLAEDARSDGESGGRDARQTRGRDGRDTCRLPNPLVPSRDDAPGPGGERLVQENPFLEPTAAADTDAATELADARSDSGDDAATEAQQTGQDARSASPMSKARLLKPALAAAGVCMVAALGVMIFLHTRHKTDEPGAVAPGEPTSRGESRIGPGGGPGPAVAGGGPAPGRSQLPATTSADHADTRSFVLASCRITASSLGVFAPGGQLPAAPDCLYCMVEANVSAGPRDLRMDLAKDVALCVDGTDFACLGLPADAQGLQAFRRAKHAVVPVAAGAAHTDTLVFEVPASARSATLKVRGLPAATAILGRPGPSPDDAELAGTWAEISPRALTPLPKDPVCAAIGDTPSRDQRLIVTLAKNVFAVRMPAAGVEGVATKIPESDGLFNAELTSADTAFKCKLRLAQGPRLVLYLQDEPFHRLVFGKLPSQATRQAK